MSEDLKDDDLEVQIEDEVEEGEAPEVITPEEGVADLKRQLDEERARRAEAERRAQEMAQRAHVAQIDKEDSDIQLVSSAIDTLKREQDQLKRELAYALQTNNHDRVADLTEQMQETSNQLGQLATGLEAMKAKPKAAPPQPVFTDPLDALLSQIQSEPSRQWVREHPEYARDPRLTQQMINAHNLVVSRGHVPDTPAYFEAVERALDIAPKAKPKAAEVDGTEGAAKVVARRDAAPAAAPVSRGQPSSRNAMTLTRAQAEAAADMGMSPKEYAELRAQLIKEGKIQA